MADPSTCPPLIPSSIATAYQKIRPYIHQTPVITSRSLDAIASSPDPAAFLSENPPTFGESEGTSRETTPKFRLHFKCENFQKIGAFKARGAFHAVTRLIDEMGVEEVRRRGVVTHSSGKSCLLPGFLRVMIFGVMEVLSVMDHEFVLYTHSC